MTSRIHWGGGVEEEQWFTAIWNRNRFWVCDFWVTCHRQAVTVKLEGSVTTSCAISSGFEFFQKTSAEKGFDWKRI